MKRWEPINAIMQLYPRSYFDSNSDGVGDIKGIIQKLDYLKGSADSLGVDAIWLSPFYTSPMRDFGYDVSDYRSVDPLFGNNEDIDELISKAHDHGISVMIDFVPNHTSSDHPWFQEAIASRSSDKRDYYIFRDPAPGGGPPNNWLSVFGGSAWEFDEKTQQYYLHSFLKEQPDLNWENPEVREEMQQVLRYWFDKSVDGIRADAVRWMGKNTEFLDDPINDNFQLGQDPYHAVDHHYSRYSFELDSYLHTITSVVHEYDNKIIIFEDSLDRLSPVESQVKRIYGVDPDVSAPFNFQAMHIGFDARAFSIMVTDYQRFVPEGARAFYCFSNHDESRLATRFGEKQARMLAVLQLSLPGIPVLYYGQELGMIDGSIPADKIQDPFEKRVPGQGLGRDPERTPMQWSDEKNAGFSRADTPWLPVADSYKSVNVAVQHSNPHSSLALYRSLLELRSQYSVFRHGIFEHHYTDDAVFAFWRYDENNRFLVVNNFTAEPQTVSVQVNGRVIISAQNNSYDPITSGECAVAPHDGVIIQCAV